MNNLGKSIFARMIQQTKDKNHPFPEDGYHGDYVITIAQEIVKKHNDTLSEESEQNLEKIRKYGEK